MDNSLEKRKNSRIRADRNKIFVEMSFAYLEGMKKLLGEVVDVNEYGLSFTIKSAEQYFIPGALLNDVVLLNGRRSSNISAEILYARCLEEDTDKYRVGIKFKSDPSHFFYNRRSKSDFISFPNRRSADRRKSNDRVDRERRNFIIKNVELEQKEKTPIFSPGPGSINNVAIENRRKFPREPLKLPLMLEINEIKDKGYLQDISPSGMLITSQVPLPVGGKLELQFSFNNDKCFMNIPTRVTTIRIASENSNLFSVGLKFEELAEVEQKILALYIQLFKDVPSIQTKQHLIQTTIEEKPSITILVKDKKDLNNKLTAKRVVITGIGAVAPNGIGREAFWRGLAEGKNCVDRISFFDPFGHSSQVAAEIRNFEPRDFIPHKEVKRMGRSAQLAVAAAQLAVSDGNLILTDAIKNHIMVILGTGTSGIEYVEEDFYMLRAVGVNKMRPYVGIAAFGGALSSEVSRSLKLTGSSLTVSTGCTGGIDAMGYALNSIRYGPANLAITGGADAAVSPGILGAFCQMGAVTTNFNNRPQKASRPFNKDRDGFVIGEGSWVFIFEELNHALRRNAKIYAEVIGYGSTCDAYHMSRPLPSGKYSIQAMESAIIDAMIQPKDVDYINAYGNATLINDSYETMVIKKVFGKHAYKLMVSSTKSMLGHSIGACGAGGVASALLAISEGIVPPTINYEVPDPDCDLDYVPNVARRCEVKIALCNTLAFGSKNAVMIVRKLDE